MSEINNNEYNMENIELNSEKKDNKNIVASLLEYFEILVFSLAFVVLLFTFCMRLCEVSGGSMRQTLIDGEKLLVSNVMYEPECGDITVSYYIAGDLVGTTDLVCAESYERDFIIYLVEKVQSIMGSLYFKVVIAVTVLLFAAVALYSYHAVKKAEKQRKIHRGR